MTDKEKQIQKFQKDGYELTLTEANKEVTKAKKETPLQFHKYFESKIKFNKPKKFQDCGVYYWIWQLK